MIKHFNIRHVKVLNHCAILYSIIFFYYHADIKKLNMK